MVYEVSALISLSKFPAACGKYKLFPDAPTACSVGYSFEQNMNIKDIIDKNEDRNKETYAKQVGFQLRSVFG